MTTYVAITDAEIDQDSPLTQVLMTKYRDNSIAIAEGAAGAPRVDLPAITAAQVEGLAALAYGSIGSMVMAKGGAGDPGLVVNGSTLRPSNARGRISGTGSALTGTWRRMGFAGLGVGGGEADDSMLTTLYLRIT